MPTESFTIDEFSQVLSDAGYLYDKLGWISGEYCFAVDLGKQVSIRIRSSIHHNGTAASTGEDSIRLWLVYKGQSLSAKDVPTGVNERWIQRTHGWQERLVTAIEKLKLFRQELGDCKVCGKPNIARVSRTAKNPGRVFTKCIECNQWGNWLDTDAILSQSVMPLLGVEKSNLKQSDEKGNREKGLSSPSSGIPDTAIANSLHCKSREGAPVSDLSEHRTLNVSVSTLGEVESASDNGNDSLTTGLSFLSSASALTMELEDKLQSKPFIPSKYQSAIFDFVKDQSDNAVVEAVAGSGKTETLVRSLQFTPTDLKVGFVAFNKHIATELQKRAPEHVHVSTLHSLGFANLRKTLGNKVQVDDRKLWHIFDDLTENLPDTVVYELRQDAATMLRLVNLCKDILVDPVPQNLDYLCDRYAIETNGNQERIYDYVKLIWKRSTEDFHTIDYSDMIFASAANHVACERFDILFVDESQDLNNSQIQMVLKSGTRIISVGDRRQSIYGFRGADTEAIPNLINALDAQTLPLSISYRCPKSVVQLAKQIVPQIEWREDAPDGKIDEITEAKFYGDVKNGDLVLCRTNAPLVKPCFDLIRRGVKATIRGRDIGNGLIQLLEKHSKREGISNLRQLLYSLEQYVENESAKLIAANKGTRAQSLQDQMETLIALSDGCYQVSEVKTKVSKIFSDEQAAVTFSSIHRAKGDESNRVYILHPELLPHPLAKQDWEQMQEQNLRYVAYTRSKSELHFVN